MKCLFYVLSALLDGGSEADETVELFDILEVVNTPVLTAIVVLVTVTVPPVTLGPVTKFHYSEYESI